MADPNDKKDDLAIMESNDGSATVDLPEDLFGNDDGGEQNPAQEAKNDGEIGRAHV